MQFNMQTTNKSWFGYTTLCSCHEHHKCCKSQEKCVRSELDGKLHTQTPFKAVFCLTTRQEGLMMFCTYLQCPHSMLRDVLSPKSLTVQNPLHEDVHLWWKACYEAAWKWNKQFAEGMLTWFEKYCSWWQIFTHIIFQIFSMGTVQTIAT